MALTPERKVKQQVVNVLKEYDVYYFFPAANGLGRAGIPDIIVCAWGSFLAMAGKGTTTKLQDKELSAIRRAGGTAMVINEDNVQALRPVLQLMFLYSERVIVPSPAERA